MTQPEGRTFADTTKRLCAIATRLLGWTPNEFWAATPTELTLSLVDPDAAATPAPPDRDEITAMMERDAQWTTNSKNL